MKKFLRRFLWLTLLAGILLGSWVFYHFAQYLETDPILKYHLQSTTLPAMEDRLFGNAEQTEQVLLFGDSIQVQKLDLLLSDSVEASLEEDRTRKLASTVTFGASGNPWHECSIVYGGDTLPARIRLRGDTPENYHYGLENASFRINLKKGTTICGFKKFSVIRPYHENGWYGYFYYHFMQEQNILANDFHFARMTGPSNESSLWVIQEAFDDHLYQSQGRADGFLMRFQDDCTEEDGHFNPSGFPRLEVINDGAIKDHPDLFEAFSRLRDLGKAPVSDSMFAACFDLKQWGKFAAINDLFYGHHSADCHNVRLFYNSDSKLLEPIAWDPGSYRFLPYEAPKTFCSWYRNRSPIYQRLFQSDDFLAAYLTALQKLTHSHQLEQVLDSVWTNSIPLETEMIEGVAISTFDPANIYRTRDLLQQQFHISDPIYIESAYFALDHKIMVKAHNPQLLPYQIGGYQYEGEWFPLKLTVNPAETVYFEHLGTPDAGDIKVRYKLPHEDEWKKTAVPILDHFSTPDHVQFP